MRQVALIPSVTDVRLTSSITPRDEGADVVAEISATLSSHGPFAAYFEVSFEGGEATAHAVIDVIEQQGFLWEARPRHAQTIEELTILVDRDRARTLWRAGAVWGASGSSAARFNEPFQGCEFRAHGPPH